MNKIEAVIFDMDGVIVDSSWYWIEVLSNIIKDHGDTITDQDKNNITGCSDDYELEILSHYIKKNKEELRQIRTDYINDHPIQYDHHIKPGIYELLNYLKEKGILISLASSSPLKDIHRMIKELHLEEYFKVIMSGELVKKAKPDPQIYLDTVRLLNIPKANILVVEDSIYGIQSAMNAGLEVLVLKTLEYDFDNQIYHIFDTHFDIIKEIAKINKYW